MEVNDKKPVLLVVDDEVDLLQVMQLTLSHKGYHVHISPNADNLLDILHNNPPDILLLDIHLNGLDGGTICQLLKHNVSTSGIPIFLFSANDNIKTIAAGCGADGFITKPFDPSSLTQELEKILA
jgi:DNA-binding response OmpR family regulator